MGYFVTFSFFKLAGDGEVKVAVKCKYSQDQEAIYLEAKKRNGLKRVVKRELMYNITDENPNVIVISPHRFRRFKFTELETENRRSEKRKAKQQKQE